MKFLHDLERVLAAGGVHITNRHDLDVLLEEIAEERAILQPHSDEGHVHKTVRTGLRRPDARGQDER
ncbi:MAG: hypothetical protein NTW21_28870 [Verrucomicrobia bacterium]|nr:hypothetical protein [Verrucomicrobiota bacterium]